MANEEKIILTGTKEELMQRIPLLLDIYQFIQSRDIGTIYGEPSTEFQVRRKFKPQVELFFKEDDDDVLPGYSPVEGRLTFRIMGEESNTISNAKLTSLGRKIKEIFGANGGYLWRKGKEMYTYSDWDKGYSMQILARTEENAQNLITNILSIQGHSFIRKNMQLSKNQDELAKFPYEPPTQTILGEPVKQPRYRPNVEVRFQYAAAHIHGLPNPKLLYSRVRKTSKALVDI